MGCVYLGDDDVPFLVAETPGEIAALITTAKDDGNHLVELTLANNSDWNNKPLYINPQYLRAISPPRDQEEDE